MRLIALDDDRAEYLSAGPGLVLEKASERALPEDERRGRWARPDPSILGPREPVREHPSATLGSFVLIAALALCCLIFAI
ncbi:MAG: hypothetical protein RLZZ127_34 [Planctomycetota bacterium]